MSDDDLRLPTWNMHGPAGMTISRPFTSTVAVTSLSVYTGGTLTDLDDLTGATEHAATVDPGGLSGTITVVIPTGGTVPLRLVVDGAVETTGTLIPSTRGKTGSDTIELAVGDRTLNLSIPSIVTGGEGGGAVSSVNAKTGVVVLTATDVGADPAGTAAGLVTPVDGRVDTLEAEQGDPRPPTAHAATHADGGSDEITLTTAQVTGLDAALTARALAADLATEQAARAAGDTALDTRVDALEAATPVQSVVAGTNVTVDNTDPQNPVVSATGSTGGAVDSVVAGSNIDVDNTDPANPIVSVEALTAADVSGLSTVATTGAYSDLTGKPTLGTAAATASTDYATAAQGAKADTAIQPAAIGTTVQGYDADLASLAGAGNSAVLAATTASFLTADETKLDGIATGATANDTDANLKNRANHTGTQLAATISDFNSAAVAAGAGAFAPLTRTVGTALATTGAVALDMAALHGTIQTITLTGNPTFTTSNKAAGRELTLVLVAGGSARTITWPSWTPLGAALPSSLASGKTAVLTVTFTGTTEASGLAAYAAQP